MADSKRRGKSAGRRGTGSKAGGKTGSKSGASRQKRSSRRRRSKAGSSRRWRAYLIGAGCLVLAGLVWAGFALEAAASSAVAALEQDLGGAPAAVYAAPRVLRPGEPLNLNELYAELRGAGYRKSERPPRSPGAYQPRRAGAVVYRRAWRGPAGTTAAAWAEIELRGGLVRELRDARGEPLEAFTCEPVPLGAFQGRLLQDRDPLPLEAFPPRLVEAVLAVEDARFHAHHGLDPIGILRAAWHDLTRGGPLQGGSTITQQVLKNRLLGHERTWTRKLKEAFLAPVVEWKLGKSRILELYLNEVYLGQHGAVSILGIPAASEHYFGKHVSDLELQEMALAAGLIASPGRYHPRRHPERAVARRNRVLDAMAEQDFIAKVERDAAAGRPLELAPAPPRLDPAGDLLDAVRRELARRGWEPTPGREPRRISTTIELPLQRAAREALEATLERLEREVPARAPLEGAVVVLRPASGAVAALVGGRRGARGELNRALDARRQPGSAFKPFVALAAVHELGWLPSREVEDTPLELGEGRQRWTPQNADRRFRGTVTLRQALEQSLNVPMARVGLEVGPARVARLAREAGIDAPLPETPALALGVGEVTPIQLATGYQTLAALGRRRAPFLVRGAQIEGRAGAREIPLAGRPPAERVVPGGDAYMVLDALAGVVERGTAKRLAKTLAGWRVAAKTGTSQGGRDAWFALACPRSVIVVWIGRDDGRPAQISGPRAAAEVVQRLVTQRPEDLLAPLPEPPGDLAVVYVEPGESCAWDEPREGARRTLVRADDRPRPCRRSFWRRLFD